MSIETNSAPRRDANSKRATLAAILSSSAGVGLIFGFQPPLIALVLSRTGASSFAIGAVAASSLIAVILLGPVYPWLIARIGLKHSVLLGIGIASLTLMAMPGLLSVPAWMLLRFIIGCAVGLGWIASEVWLNCISTAQSRSTVMSLYGTVLSAGTLCGPLLLEVTGTRGALPFVTGAVCLALTILPVVLLTNTRIEAQARTGIKNLLPAFKVAPEVILAAFVAGLVESADLALLPLYAVQSGAGERIALLFATVFIAGNVMLQLPIGMLADRYGRRGVLSVCAVVSGVGPSLLGSVLHSPAILWPLLFVWGGTLYAFYSQGIALLGDAFAARDLAVANTMFVMVYCLGGVIGPGLGGLAMDLSPKHGLGWVLSFASLLLLLGLALGARVKAKS